MKYERCLRCGRKLKTEQSKNIGFGTVCEKKWILEGKYKELFPVAELSNEKSEPKEE